MEVLDFRRRTICPPETCLSAESLKFSESRSQSGKRNKNIPRYMNVRGEKEKSEKTGKSVYQNWKSCVLLKAVP